MNEVFRFFVFQEQVWYITEFKIQRGDDNETELTLQANLPSFSLYLDYSYPLTLSNVGELSWS